MSVASHPLTLWLAAAGCLAMAARARRCAAARPGGPPWVLSSAARAPCPPALRTWLAREGDGERIARAGASAVLDADGLARARAAGAAAGAACGLALAVAAPPLAAAAGAGAALGALAPGRWLARRARARRAALVRELPDLLDLLGICVEAGMALDPALALAAERLGGSVGAEVERVLGDLAMGAPRASAYRDLVERSGSAELAETVAALLQAEELGAPLSTALEGQADALRARRRQEARERAATAAPKIQLVVAVLMVPAALVVVLGALAVELSRQVGAVVGAP